jgi:hypothetical protein
LDPDDLTRFRQWIVGFAVIKFDLEIGQGKWRVLLHSLHHRCRLLYWYRYSFSIGLRLPSNGARNHRAEEHVSIQTPTTDNDLILFFFLLP